MFEVAGAPEKDSFPFWSYEDLALLIAAILPSLLIGSLLTRFSGASNKGLQTLLFQSTFFALLLTALYLLVSLRYRRPFWRSMGWSWPVRGAWWCLAAGPVLAFFIPALG